MSLLATVAPHLPFVRRYSRALTGSQEAGDHFVRLAIEALASGEQALERDAGPRAALYRVFQSTWHGVDGQLPPPAAAVNAPARLMRIAPASRQAFLLTAMEGFTASETARIMGVDFDTVDDLILAAQREIDAELATDVLIIEDEPVIAADIEALVKELGHNVSDLAATRAEARSSASARRPGLILADIQLADGSSGIDAVKDILAEINVPVIFITAFPERLLTGDKPEPAFLITKPFDPVTVKAAIGQALFFHPERTSPAS